MTRGVNTTECCNAEVERRPYGGLVCSSCGASVGGQRGER